MDEAFDFVVIGSGGGAMSSALYMRSRGKSVLILEKTGLVGGTTARSGGVMWIPNNRFMKEAGVEDSTDKALSYLDCLVGDDPEAKGATPARRRAYVEQAPQMLDFLVAQGLKFRRLSSWPDYYDSLPGGMKESRTVVSQLYDSNLLGSWKSKLRPTFVPVPINIDEAQQLAWVNKSNKARMAIGRFTFRMITSKLMGKHLVPTGNALQGQMLGAVLNAGAQVRLEAPVKDIIVENGRAIGVVATIDGKERRIGAKLGVLINAGGFAHNQVMRDKYMPGTKAEYTSVAEGDTGEMIEAAERLGAATAQMDAAISSQIAVPPGPLGPIKPIMQTECARPHTIVVDQSGERYMNETGSYVDFVQGMFKRDKVSPAIPSWLIFDSQFAAKYTVMNMSPPKMPQGLYDAGFITKADTLDQLAATCKLDAAKLKASVERFNTFARAGKDEDFNRGGNAFQQWQGDPFNTPSAVLGTLEQGPYYAIKLYPGDVGTYGGLVTDEYARVLKTDGAPIEGLYATGTSTASALGKLEPAAGGSVGPSFVFGYVAAKHATGANA